MFELDGCFDMHVHAGPDVFERAVDDVEVATRCRAAGMAGIAVKGHVESTASRAYHTNRQVQGFRYVGGICLNYGVGGINPAAVDASLRLGGRVVWMPSAHSRFHAESVGILGGWSYPEMRIYTPAGACGISVLDEAGRLTAATREVVALVREHDAVVGTSHLSPAEILALADYCRQLQVKVLVNHIRWLPAYDAALAERAVELGAFVEIASSTVGGYTNRFPIAEAAALIKELGPARIVVASDAGGVRHPSPHEALRVLANNLLLYGVSEADLRAMMATNPLRLVSQGAAA